MKKTIFSSWFMAGMALVVMLVSLPARAVGPSRADIEVRASLQSSTRIEWKQLPLTLPEVEDAVVLFRQQMQQYNTGEVLRLIPLAALQVLMQTNDPNNQIAFHVDSLQHVNSQRELASSHLFVSVGGGTPRPMDQDLTLLSKGDHGNLKEFILLLAMLERGTQRSGRYMAQFRFVTTQLP